MSRSSRDSTGENALPCPSPCSWFQILVPTATRLSSRQNCRSLRKSSKGKAVNLSGGPRWGKPMRSGAVRSFDSHTWVAPRWTNSSRTAVASRIHCALGHLVKKLLASSLHRQSGSFGPPHPVQVGRPGSRREACASWISLCMNIWLCTAHERMHFFRTSASSARAPRRLRYAILSRGAATMTR